MDVSFCRKHLWKILLGLLVIGAVVAVVLVFVVFKESSEEYIPKKRTTWAYRCAANKCELVENPDEDNTFMSLNVCQMTCGDQIGTLWPYPKMVQWTDNRPLVTFNPTKIIFPTRQQKDPLVSGIEELFSSRVQRKIPSGFKHKTDKQLELIFNYPEAVQVEFGLQLDESYTLSIKEDVETSRIVVQINANNIFGIQHGLQTLQQLIIFDVKTDQLLILKSVLITDSPAFPHRGLSLDTSRNFYSLASIKRTIDAMSLSKLNVFHWHITDSHSFPLVLDSHPTMAKYGAYTPEKVYSRSDIQEVIDFAKIRGIAVIPEIDAPAHVGNGWQGMDLVACWNGQPWTLYCLEPPCGQLDPTREKLYEVLEDIYRETMEIFGQPHLFHMGGDEVLSACWKNSTRIIDWMTELGWGQTENDYMKLWNHFQENALKAFDATVKNQKTPVILWSSSLTKVPQLNDLDRERYIVQVWGAISDQNSIRGLLENKFRVIISNHDALYLDCGFGNWVAEGNNWCSPYIGWKKVYDNRMDAVVQGLTAEERELILGGEVALWSEQTDEWSLDQRLFPRASAYGERLWTNPASGWREAEVRMLAHREELIANGISVDSIKPEWCTRNEEQCGR